MIKKLRRRFIIITVSAVTLVLTLLCLIVNIANFVSVNSGIMTKLTAIADNRGTMPSPPDIKRPDDKKPDDRFNEETPFSTRYFVLKYTPSGELVKADLDRIAAVTADDTDTYLSIALTHGEGFGKTGFYKDYVVKTGEDRYMAVFLDCRDELRSVVRTAVLSAAAMVMCVSLVYVIVLLCSRRAIDPLVAASNRQKQFITDAGHELKTPITVISTTLKVLELEKGESEWIDKALTQTERLSELVNSLVTLSRMDEDESPLNASPFKIDLAAAEIADSFVDYASDRQHSLISDIDSDITFCGDEYAVRRLISVLIDNAIKYSSPGTPIYFSLKKSKKGVIIKTENTSEQEIKKEDLPKMFDRFWRADKARSGGKGGFGIGLSLAKSVAEGHSGTIKAESVSGTDITITAELKDQPPGRMKNRG